MMYLLILDLKTEESKRKVSEYLEEMFTIKITDNAMLINDTLPLTAIGSHIEECMGRDDTYLLSDIGTLTTNMNEPEILEYNDRL